MKKICSFIVSGFVVAIMLIGSAAARADLIDSVTINPELRSTNSPLTVVIAGTFPTAGYTIVETTSQFDSNSGSYIVTLSVIEPTGTVAQILTPYSVSHDIGILPAGWQRVQAAFRNQGGQVLATKLSTFFVSTCTAPTVNPLAPIVCDLDIATRTGLTIDWKPTIEDARGTDPVTCRIDTPPLDGSATVAPNCSTGAYTPPAFATSEEFTYTAHNGIAESPPARVAVVVVQNSPPFAYDASGAGLQDTVIAWAPFVVDPNEVDMGRLRCRIVQQSTNGILAIADDCSSGTFTPNSGFVGSASGTYAASDGDLESTPGQVGIDVTPRPTACTIANPLRTITLGTGKGVEGTLVVSFTGHILSGTNKSVTICPGTTPGFTASASRERDYLVTCWINDTLVNKIFGAVSGTVKTGDSLRCTNKEPPDDPDTTFYPGRDTDNFIIKN